MTCSLCDNDDAEEVEIKCNDTQKLVKISVCDACLIAAKEDSFALTNLIQSKIDVDDGT